MHEVTASEAATLLSVLAKSGAGERLDSAYSELPASTFYAVRRKVYNSGWLSDRFVPDPWAIGITGIECSLVKPSPVDRTRLERDWISTSENVLLWAGLNVVLGVFFRRDSRKSRIENGTTITVTPASGSIPVYFDYSRAWSRFIRVERETGYPRALSDGVPRGELSIPAAVSELVRRDNQGQDLPVSTHRWHSVAGLSRNQQRALERGTIRSRTFLNLEALPPYEGRVMGEIVFLTGELRAGVSPTEVLGALNNECRVSPILVASDGTSLLIVALGQVEAGASGRIRLARSARPVAATLDALLKKIDLTVEHTESVRKLVDHRYDRLFAEGLREEGS